MITVPLGIGGKHEVAQKVWWHDLIFGTIHSMWCCEKAESLKNLKSRVEIHVKMSLCNYILRILSKSSTWKKLVIWISSTRFTPTTTSSVYNLHYKIIVHAPKCIIQALLLRRRERERSTRRQASSFFFQVNFFAHYILYTLMRKCVVFIVCNNFTILVRQWN